MKKKKADGPHIELLLSILIAVAVGFGLEKLILIKDDLIWFTFSILTIIFSVAFIYLILGLEKLNINNLLKLIVLCLVIFFPFALFKANESAISSGFDWDGVKQIWYSIIMGVTFIGWGITELKENKVKAGVIITFGTIIIVAVISLAVLIHAKAI